MPLVPKRSGKKRAVAISERLWKRAVEWADREEYTLGSVLETALEEFLDDRKDEEVLAGGGANGAKHSHPRVSK